MGYPTNHMVKSFRSQSGKNDSGSNYHIERALALVRQIEAGKAGVPANKPANSSLFKDPSNVGHNTVELVAELFARHLLQALPLRAHLVRPSASRIQRIKECPRNAHPSCRLECDASPPSLDGSGSLHV